MDLLLHNGNFRTMSGTQPVAESLLVRDGRILCLGPFDEVSPRCGRESRRIDLAGRTVVPGFNDCHMHILPYGLDLGQANLSPQAGITDVPALTTTLSKWAAENPSSEWALGNRYDQNTFPDASHPTRDQLDDSFPDKPAFVMQTSKHAGAANSIALKLAGITRDTPNPEGGEIVRDRNGEPTGLLLESAVSLVTKHIPKPDRVNLISAIHRANSALAANGITSASDLSTGWHDLSLEVESYLAAADEGAPIRTTLCPHAPKLGRPEYLPTPGQFATKFGIRGSESGSNRVRMGPIKLFADGALTVRTAALREPYSDGAGMGMLLHPPDELKAYVRAAHGLGWQIAVHAIGDRAVDLVLDAYDEAQAANPSANCRHRIEHAMLVDDALIQRFVRQEVVPVVQPEFITRLGDAYILGLGMERASRLNPNSSMIKAGLPVAFSSDCPIVPGAPLDGIKAACLRTTRKGAVLGQEERVSAIDGLRNYTYCAAYCSFDESETGTLEPGKRADMTILSEDLTDLSLDTIHVVATIIGGRFAYGEANAA